MNIIEKLLKTTRKQVEEFLSGLHLLIKVSFTNDAKSKLCVYVLSPLLIVSSLLSASTPILFKYFIDGTVQQSIFLSEKLYQLLIIFCSCQIIARLITELKWKYFGIIEARAQRNLAEYIFKSIFYVKYGRHEKRKNGKLLTITEKAHSSLRISLVNIFLNLIPLMMDIIIYFSLMAYLFHSSIPLYIIFVPLMMYLVILMICSEFFYKYQKIAREFENKIPVSFTEKLINYDCIKLFHNEREQFEKHQKIIIAAENNTKRTWEMRSKIGIYQSLLLSLTISSTVVLSLIYCRYGDLTLGSVALTMIMFFQLLRPLEGLGFIYRETKQAILDLFMLDDSLTGIEKDLQFPALTGPFVPNSNGLEFKNVSFWYPDGSQVLKDINFSVPLNSTLGITGPSGAGKSTLIRLIFRLYDCQEGQIFIEGINIKNYSKGDLSKKLGIAPQETSLFNTSIKDNLLFGNPSASYTQMIEAAKQADIHSFISQLPEGYETIIGERGTKLSGGERQRIGIARAILMYPEILIYDEATSSLDSTCEKRIIKNIYKNNKSKILIIAAHNLNNIKNADNILVLEKGEVNSFSSHKLLLEKENNLYASLWYNSQKSMV